MKHYHFKEALARLLSDRSMVLLVAAIILTGFLYLAVVGLSLQARDVQVYTHYTAFGEAHFYKSHWQYLVSFIAFGVVLVIGHIGLMVKLHHLERRQTAILVGYATIVMLILVGAYALSVLRLAFR